MPGDNHGQLYGHSSWGHELGDGTMPTEWLLDLVAWHCTWLCLASERQEQFSIAVCSI